MVDRIYSSQGRGPGRCALQGTLLMTETELTARSTARMAPKGFLTDLSWLIWFGVMGLGLGAILAWLAVRWSDAALSLLSLAVVFGSLGSVGLGLMQDFGRRFRRN